jgi:hypothetical protein
LVTSSLHRSCGYGWKRGTDYYLRVDTNFTQGILSCSVFNQSHFEPGKFLSLLVEIYVPSPHTADCLHGARDRGWWQTGRGVIIGNTMRRAAVVVPRKEVCRHCYSQLWYSHCCNNKRWNPIESFLLVVVGAKETSNNRQHCTIPPFHLEMAVFGFELRLSCYKLLSRLAKALKLPTCSREVQGSPVRRDTDYRSRRFSSLPK